jgi:hypothetical protein
VDERGGDDIGLPPAQDARGAGGVERPTEPDLAEPAAVESDAIEEPYAAQPPDVAADPPVEEPGPPSPDTPPDVDQDDERPAESEVGKGSP